MALLRKLGLILFKNNLFNDFVENSRVCSGSPEARIADMCEVQRIVPVFIAKLSEAVYTLCYIRNVVHDWAFFRLFFFLTV